MNATIGILAASSYEAILERHIRRREVATRFGAVSVLEGEAGGRSVFFIRRFGPDDDLRSDLVNHAAHAVAFRRLGVRRAITLNGFGAVNRDYEVGDLVVYDDFIKLCERLPTTIFADDKGWFRANMNVPFCPELRRALVDSARAESNRRVHDGGVNICVQGPHNETPAEIDLYRLWGADVVCTAIYPEVAYFRELETCYAGLSWLSDVAGVEDQADWVMMTPDELAPVIRRAIGEIPDSPACGCQDAWAGSEESLPRWYRDIRS